MTRPFHIPLLALLTICAFILIRIPDLLYFPRFWAEEGSIYFTHALTHPWHEALLFTYAGYYNLYMNVATWLATLVPLEFAPRVTTWLALFPQLLPHAVIWFGRSPHWDSYPKKIVASFIILVVAESDRIWLNTLGAQYHLPITTFLILLEDMAGVGRTKKITYSLILALNGLTGSISCFLVPFFIVRAWRTRLRIHKAFAAIISAAALLQFAIFVHMLQTGGAEMRFQHVVPGWLVFLTVESNLITPFNKSQSVFYHGWIAIADALRIRLNHWIAPAGLLVIFFGITAYFAKGLRGLDRFYFAGAFILLSFCNTAASRNGIGGTRYSYSSCVIFMLMVLQSVGSFRSMRSIVAAMVIAAALLIGTINYFDGTPVFHKDWPVWREEVRKRRGRTLVEIPVHPRWNEGFYVIFDQSKIDR